MFSYRVGAFGWKLAARLGFSLQVQVQILFDQEAGVFVAETTDFMPDFGCVVESDTLEGLEKKLFCAFEDAFEEIFKKPVKFTKAQFTMPLFNINIQEYIVLRLQLV